jgi:phthiocerol/phenolphthiocerol synthesis type-I polyketide synthase E
MAMAEVEPETIELIEAHGTGIPLGDPIELAALEQAFRCQHVKPEPCHLDETRACG